MSNIAEQFALHALTALVTILVLVSTGYFQ